MINVEWDGRIDGGEKIASGVYFYSLTVEMMTAIRKMVLMR